MSNALSEQEARERILHILEIYPAVSPSMMNIAMNSVDSKVWKPVLEQMLMNGDVLNRTIYALTPIGRNQSYTIYYHPKFDYQHHYENFAKSSYDSATGTFVAEPETEGDELPDNGEAA